jgi:hypothetical protein
MNVRSIYIHRYNTYLILELITCVVATSNKKSASVFPPGAAQDIGWVPKRGSAPKVGHMSPPPGAPKH